MQGGLPYTPWAADLRKQRMATFSQDNPDANCLPVGLNSTRTRSRGRSSTRRTTCGSEFVCNENEQSSKHYIKP